MKNFIVSALLITVAASSLAAAEPKQFRYQANLSGDFTEDSPALVTLTAAVISRTHDDFADLRLFDDANREVPYVIYGKTLPGENRQQANLEPVKYEALYNGGERITYQRPASWSGIDGMQVLIDGGDFEKIIQVETSDDNKTWKPLATCSVFDYSSRINLRNTKLDIPPTTARYVRLIMSGEKPATNNTNNASEENVVLKYKDLEFRTSLPTNPTTATTKPPRLVTGVVAWYGKTVKERQVADCVPLAISDNSVNKDGNTIIDLGETNLPLTLVNLDIGTKYFMRQVRVEASTGKKDAPWYPVADGSIYRFPAANRDSNNRPSFNTGIQLDGSQYSHLRLVIINRDNTPLTVNSVSGTYLQRNLYLLLEKSHHYAIFCDANVNAPRYDLPSVLPENSPELAKAVTWTIAEPHPNPMFNNKDEKPVARDNNGITPTQLWLFRGLILLLAGGLAFWAWSTLRKLK